jgi:hypothetical protein
VQLDRLQAVLRPRTSFEAIDLGFAMTRRWWGGMYRAWFLCVTPIYALVWALLHDHPGWAIGVLWWLIPIFDRVPLFVLSRELFGERIGVRDVVRALPHLWTRHLFYTLLLFRLDLARSFVLPMLQLEGGDAGSRGRRRSALTRDMTGPAVWLTFVFFMLHLIMAAAFLVLVIAMLPERPEWTLEILWDNFWDGVAPWWLYASMPAAEFLGLSLVEPLYVAGGFALYLNRRTHLEGWDIELVFRRLADRLVAASSRASRLAAVVLVALALLAGGALLAPARAFAQEAPYDPGYGVSPDQIPPKPEKLGPTRPAEADPKATIAKVLERPEFGRREKRWVWRLRDEPSETARRNFRMPSFLQWIGQFFAKGIEGILWLVAGVVLAWLIFVIVSRLRALGPREKRGKASALSPPVVGFTGAPVAAMPDDVPGAAWALYESGRHVEALGLLYRGALASLASRRAIVVAENATEGECIGVVRREAPAAVARFFETVTRTWQVAAYAHRVPEAGHVRELCARWPEHFLHTQAHDQPGAAA